MTTKHFKGIPVKFGDKEIDIRCPDDYFSLSLADWGKLVSAIYDEYNRMHGIDLAIHQGEFDTEFRVGDYVSYSDSAGKEYGKIIDIDGSEIGVESGSCRLVVSASNLTRLTDQQYRIGDFVEFTVGPNPPKYLGFIKHIDGKIITVDDGTRCFSCPKIVRKISLDGPPS